jgi:protein-disulfide isomerase
MFNRLIRSFAIVVLALPALAAFPGATFAQTTGQPKPVDAAELAKPNPLGEMSIGAANAPVTIIQYSSLKCHRCRSYFADSFPEIKARYIDTGKLRYILREAAVDPVDAAAFLLARCAAKDDKAKYFDMVRTLFRQDETWNVARPLQPLRDVLTKAGMSEADFNACLSNQDMLDKINALNNQIVQKLVLKGEDLPAIFINGTRFKYNFVPTAAELTEAIDRILKSQ